MLALLLLAAASPPTSDLFEIEVYNAATVEAGHLLAEQHFNVTDEHGAHLTYEFVYGIVDWFEVATYVANQFDSGSHDFGWAEWRLRVRPRTPDSWPIRASFNIESAWTEDGFESLELRPIWSTDWKLLRLDVAPAVEIESGGDVLFEPEARLAVVLGWFEVGVEYYGAGECWHQLYAVGDLVHWKDIEINVGVGFGLTSTTDPLVVKTIAGYRF